ncbi:hypothetical protein J8C02_06070 [Chloracidobacterium sp. MS 40/45]|uniref:hypothetical protein n=1 Tax=Chloracidobacterium aggregatum TaxID=2851959 RepID=UPI001B8B6A48|nr:hypothetical protein [Chloracidobacterium aggregatum]QUV99004.1 hypothetical protein J8C02_06070 [Chloracidobacterium sp. MS 40/45]
MPILKYLLCWLLVILPLTPAGRAQQDTRPLSLEQIKRLIQNDFPDTALAGEIRDRGIDFSTTFDRQTLESLRLLGAQEKTLRALEPYLPKASVRVITRLDRTIVFVDGKQYGITDTTGILQINDLEPGEHLIETRNRPRYKDGQLRVVLRPRDNQEVVFEPEVNVGTLTITPLTPNLEVTVYNELASLTGTFAKRELAPGIYTLQARSRWHQPITQIIQIKAGQHLTLPVELELDEALLETTVVEAQKAFSSKDYTRSVNILLEVLNITPRNLPALNLLAQNYLRLNDTPNFTATAKRILDADGTLDFALLLHTEKKGPQPVRLQLSRTALTLEWLDGSETQTFPLENFSRAFIRGDVQSEIFLVLAGARAPKRIPDLQFSMANTYDPRDENREPQLSQRDKINLLWNIEEVLRFSLEVHREFLAVAAARPGREPARPADQPPSGKGKPAVPASRAQEPAPDPPDQTARKEPGSAPKAPQPDTGNDSRKKKEDAKKAKDTKRKETKPEVAQEKQKADRPTSATDRAATDRAVPNRTSPAPPARTEDSASRSAASPKTTDENASLAALPPRDTVPATAPPRTPAPADTAAAVPPDMPDDLTTGAPFPVRARALIGTMIGAVGGRATVERITAAQFYGTQITTEPDLTTPTSAPDPKPIRQFWTRNRQLRFEVSPGTPTGLVYLRVEKDFWQRANGRVERITQTELLRQVRMQSKLAGVGLYQQLLSPENKVIRFSRHLADGRVEETIRVTDRDGDTYDVVIDLETRRPQKCTYQLPTDLGQPLQIEERYEDFRLVSDVWLPHRIIRSVQGGRTVTMTFTDIQLPPALSGDLFRRP